MRVFENPELPGSAFYKCLENLIHSSNLTILTTSPLRNTSRVQNLVAQVKFYKPKLNMHVLGLYM